MNTRIRPYQPDDLEELKRMTVEAFDGIAIDQRVEEHLGVLHGRDWRWRKARHIDDDVEANPAGVFVAEADGKILGYITTRIEREAGKGRIPNLAVIPEARGGGVGRRLIEHALEYFRREGMSFAMIETMAYNEIGNHLYPACGFVEIARQVHFARKL
jgi:ribosomal protein S18 acetylase RimI-like enzyme